MSTGISHHVEELARRETDGVEVALLWNPSDGSLTVVCADVRTGEQFAVAADAAKALDVFYHPYAYAARQRVSAGEALAA